MAQRILGHGSWLKGSEVMAHRILSHGSKDPKSWLKGSEVMAESILGHGSEDPKSWLKGSWVLAQRPNVRVQTVSEMMFCRIFMCMWSLGPYFL